MTTVQFLLVLLSAIIASVVTSALVTWWLERRRPGPFDDVAIDVFPMPPPMHGWQDWPSVWQSDDTSEVMQ